MNLDKVILVVLAGALSLASACSASSTGRAFGDGGGTSSSETGEGNTTGSGGSSGSQSSGEGGFNPQTATTTGGPGVGCDHPADVDGDMDGFTGVQGDCNDCDPNMNPGAIDVVNALADANGQLPEPSDEDCDGVPDNAAPPCDDGLLLDDIDPISGAKAIDLCQAAAGDKWGLISAEYVKAFGIPTVPALNIGLFDSFGSNVKVQGGKRMLGLSTGFARVTGQPGACYNESCLTNGMGWAPPGFPQDVPSCPGDKAINDDVALEVKLRAPTNARGYAFNFKYYTFEYPEWICSEYNDQFIALVDPPPPGSMNGNISFDSKTNPVSVNLAFFDVCNGCLLGPGELLGTGFDTWDEGGATSWLVTQAPLPDDVDEITIRFAIWDTGDRSWDSTVLIDNFQWIATGGSVTIETTPQPEPK